MLSLRHSRRSCFPGSWHSTSTFLPPFAPRELPRFNARMRALTSAALSSPTNALTSLRISMLRLPGLPTIPSPTTVTPCPYRQLHTTPTATGFHKTAPWSAREQASTRLLPGRPFRSRAIATVLRFEFRRSLAGSPMGLAETGSLYYGLVVLLQLLPTSNGAAIPAAPPSQLLSDSGRRVST